MVTNASGLNRPVDTIGATDWIAVGELISLLIPLLDQAHKRGWINWGGCNERPRNFNCRFSEADVLNDLDGMAKRGVIVARKDPLKGNSAAISCEANQPVTFVSPGTDSHITREWQMLATEVDRARTYLVPLIERQGQYDAAAEWKFSEGRLTPIEAAERLKLIGESREAFVTRLAKAARAGEIPAFAPGQRVRRAYTPVDAGRSPWNFEDEFYPSDLDDWIKGHESHIRFRFDLRMDARMVALADSYNAIVKRGEKPSRRSVADESGFDRGLVGKKWAELERRVNLPK